MFLIGKQSKLYCLCTTGVVLCCVVGSGIIKGRISFGEVVVHHPLPQLSYTLSGPPQMIFVKLDDAYQ